MPSSPASVDVTIENVGPFSVYTTVESVGPHTVDVSVDTVGPQSVEATVQEVGPQIVNITMPTVGPQAVEVTTGYPVSLRSFPTVAALLASTRTGGGAGTEWRAGSYYYEELAADASNPHVTTVAGVKLNIADAQWYFEHFGVGPSPADCRAKCQQAIDASGKGRRIEFATLGPYRTTGGIYTKWSDMDISGPNGGQVDIEFVNAAGGTVFAGDEDEHLSTAVYQRVRLGPIRILSVSASTDASKLVDYTSYSNSTIRVYGQSKRANAELFYGQGNNGQSPYFVDIDLSGCFGGDPGNYTQTGVVLAPGTWPGGSNGCNAVTIRNAGRSAGLGMLVDLRAGTGCKILEPNGESLDTAYIRLNYNPSVDSGTSSGSNGQVTFKDTSKAWTTNAFTNDAIKITGGTGEGQIRIISINSSTQITLKEPWGIVPDATSTYEIYEGKVKGLYIGPSRGEGLVTLNPDFIQAYPGTQNVKVAWSEVQSLGTGLYVRDESGSPDNDWFGGKRLVFTHTFENPGSSANINAYPRSSVFGGIKVPGNYVVEWLKANSSALLGDTADVRLDVGGTTVGGGAMTLRAQIPSGGSIATAFPGPTEKINRSGTNDSLFLNLQTGAAFGASADVQATFCVSMT